MLERDVIRRTLAFARKAGVASIRYYAAPGAAAGWPDYLFLIPGGRPLFIEFKRPGGKPTQLQEHRIKTLRDLGYDVEVCDDSNKATAAITSRVAAARLPDKGESVPDRKRSGRVVRRSGDWEDFDHSGGV